MVPESDSSVILLQPNHFIVAVFTLLVSFAITCGCRPEDPTQPDSADRSGSEQRDAADGVTADQILAMTKAVYENAENYYDDGKLLLSYRKDGLLTEEPQRWSTSWTADGKVALEIFGAQLKGDGQRLSCYVYDIDTANLDGQRMVVPYAANGQPPIEEVFGDSIASVFLGGYSELPLNETDPLLRGKLVPAPVNLLTGQLHCPWLHAPVGLLERLPDQTLGKHDCYVVRSSAAGMGCDLWIEKSSSLLIQMSLPLKLLDPQVMAAPNITDLKMLARFENAAINSTIDPQTFQLQDRKNATPVRRFIRLPEALPAESIGQVVERFRLMQPDGKLVDHLHFDGKPTVLLWLGGENSYTAIGELNKLATRQPSNHYQCNYGVIYSDTELTGTTAQPHLVRPELTAAMASSDIPMFYDPGLAASIEFAIRDIPSVILMDGGSRVQFATLIDAPQWSQALASAMIRVSLKQDVATEMLNHYREHMAGYQAELTLLDASSLMPKHLLSEPTSKADLDRASASELPRRSNPPLVSAKRLWTSEQFQQPGNVSCLSTDRPTIMVFDGARTVVQLNTIGEVVARNELDLPDGIGVNRLRIRGDDPIRAVFSQMGERVFLFDDTWQPVGVIPNKDVPMKGPFTDVQVEGISDEPLGLNIASKNSGLSWVSIKDGRFFAGQKSKAAVESLATGSDDRHAETYFIADQALYSTAGSLSRPFLKVDLPFRFNTVESVLGGEQRFYVASGFDDQQGWILAAFGPLAVEPVWTQNIGSQFFETLIEPVSTLETRSSRLRETDACIAVACRQNKVHLFNRQGKWLTDIALNDAPRGIGLIAFDSNVHVVISLDNRVECWALE